MTRLRCDVLAVAAVLSGCCRAVSHSSNDFDPAFVVRNRNVTVVIVPSGALGPAFGGCETSSPWHDDLAAPLLSALRTKVLSRDDIIRHVAILNASGDALEGVRSGLRPHEVGIVIDPQKVTIYGRARIEYYCISILEEVDVLIRLKLFDLREQHGGLDRPVR
jgi:hypothetical protein